MLSEKTFKPIIAGQLFVLIASPGAIQFLRDIGIDTFDDIIDHSYDQIEDTKIRIQRAVEEVDRLVKLDLTKLYDQLRIRLIKNSVYYRSPEFRSQFKLNFD
jgi:phosphate uptake regulator